MAIDIYKGTIVTAQDAHEMIDASTILSGCSSMKDVSQKLNDISFKIGTLQSLCTKENLSIDGVGFDEKIGEYQKSVQNFSLYLDDLASSITTTCEKVLNRKQVILNEEAKRQEKEQLELKGGVPSEVTSYE